MRWTLRIILTLAVIGGLCLVIWAENTATPGLHTVDRAVATSTPRKLWVRRILLPQRQNRQRRGIRHTIGVQIDHDDVLLCRGTVGRVK